MSCCEHRCTEGQNCPVRRVRAGGAPPSDLPAPGDDFKPEEYRDEGLRALSKWALFVSTLLSIVFTLSVIASYLSA